MILNPDLIGALISSSGAIFFAMSFIFVRKATVSGDSLKAVITTIWINFILFLTLTILFYYPEFNFTKTALLAFGVSGLLGTFLGRTFIFLGIERVGASRTVPITRGSALVAVLLGIYFLNESLHMGHLIGIVLLVAGIMIISYEMRSGNSTGGGKLKSYLDMFFPFAAMIFVGLDSVVAKMGLNEGTPVLAGLTIKFSVALFLMSAYFISKGYHPLSSFRSKEMPLYLGAAAANSIAMLLYWTALAVSRVVVVMPFFALAPLFVLIFSYFYLHDLEKITTLLVSGTILIVTGVILITRFM